MTTTTLASVAAVTGSLAAAAVAVGVRRTTRVRVSGPSMQPTYDDGDRLLVWRTRRVRPGQVIVLRAPRGHTGLWVKRVHDVGEEGVDVRGDEPDRSTDSRHVGPVPRRLVVGRVVRRYATAADPVSRRR
ncbi:MAG: nickel-type superoxide dismutase maturation protease [Actinomycetota bacterium]